MEGNEDEGHTMTHISEQMVNILHEERLAKAEHARLVRSYEPDRLAPRRWFTPRRPPAPGGP
ncbi:hypothetical protein [Georgenia subflava]|uniref:Uncharacterized protein n=1 Tax=Georgenia subflava TaxID=1622177 RepID=A0A6N7EMS4_9MICO|nr:hypothetical protein [Georgenia subflava]MPV37446.1 hypothetical protein [Georgenia subflava]